MKTDIPSYPHNLGRPPLYTVLSEIVGWALDRTANLPKRQRFAFGQWLMNRHAYVLLANRSPKAETIGEKCIAMPRCAPLPSRSQEASLTAVPAPAGDAGKVRIKIGKPGDTESETHGPQPPRELELEFR